VLRQEYFDSKITAEIRGIQFGTLPTPPLDQWAIAIEMI
jgi:hypothetical protein